MNFSQLLHSCATIPTGVALPCLLHLKFRFGQDVYYINTIYENFILNTIRFPQNEPWLPCAQLFL